MENSGNRPLAQHGRPRSTWIAAASALVAQLAQAQSHPAGSDAELAEKLSNPVAAMISVPFQFNFDRNIGPIDGGIKRYINVQPVIPFQLNDDWNLITRVIVPVVDQSDIVPGAGSQSGLGDTTASLFFSPVKPTSGGWLWAIGPAFYIPTATEDLLGAKKWGLGPTALDPAELDHRQTDALRQDTRELHRRRRLLARAQRDRRQGLALALGRDRADTGMNRRSVPTPARKRA